MKYFSSVDGLLFYKDPECFNKYSTIEMLKYAIGANLYMPGTQNNVFEKLINNTFREIGAITLCCEDAIAEEDLPKAEDNIIHILNNLYEKYYDNHALLNELPLIFIRVRNPNQFKQFSKKFQKKHLKMLCGFNFPKFNSLNGYDYFQTLNELSKNFDEVLYGMPILEDDNLIYKETRFNELSKIQSILSEYSTYVLNIRVGGTDFSSRFGLRRSIDSTIYDTKVVADCLIDILNFFLRQNHEFVVSGPVWEYFSNNENSPEIQGLIKELKLDMENGFQGKTIIHPSQINAVNKQYVVPYDEYIDAINILEAIGGVFKGSAGNRMNEVAPHKNWAKKIKARARVFGVLDKNSKI